MTEIILERTIGATPEQVFDASLDPELHVRSMARHRESMVESPAGGVFREGSTVTWRAWHFGIPFRLRSRVFDVERPRRFCDEQISGPFAAFHHEHLFTPAPDGTLMRDVITFRSPLGPLGRMVDAIVLRRYMTHLISSRNDTISALFDED